MLTVYLLCGRVDGTAGSPMSSAPRHHRQSWRLLVHWRADELMLRPQRMVSRETLSINLRH